MAADVQTIALLLQTGGLFFYAGQMWRTQRNQQKTLDAHTTEIKEHDRLLTKHETLLSN